MPVAEALWAQHFSSIWVTKILSHLTCSSMNLHILIADLDSQMGEKPSKPIVKPTKPEPPRDRKVSVCQNMLVKNRWDPERTSLETICAEVTDNNYELIKQALRLYEKCNKTT